MASATVTRLLVGVMITSNVTPQHRARMRTVTTQALECGCDAKLLFFAGASNFDFASEIAEHKDIVQLDFPEKMNEGKTYRWFALANMLRSSFLFDAAFKMDADTSVDWCSLCRMVADAGAAAAASPDFYVGRLNEGERCGEMPNCPPDRCVDYSGRCWVYMSGGFYGMSASALGKLMVHPYTRLNSIGHEDIQVGRWFKRVLPDVRLVYADNGVVWCHNSAFHKSYPTGNVRQRWVDCSK